MALYRLVRLLLRLIFRVVFRWKVIGADNIPESGPVLVAANHISLLDPPVVGCAVRREISYMAKAELFERPIFRWFLAKLKAFPVRRGKADRTAIRTALEILKQGGVVGLFPEGTRSRTGEMLSPQHGVALLAIKSNAVIVPTAVYGTNRVDKLFGFIPIPPKIYVKFGKPMEVSQYEGRVDKNTVAEVSVQVMRQIRHNLRELELYRL